MESVGLSALRDKYLEDASSTRLCSEIEAEWDEEGDLAATGSYHREARYSIADDQESLQHQVVPDELGIGQDAVDQ